jgi:3-methyladenine DNA glycosylase AlkD
VVRPTHERQLITRIARAVRALPRRDTTSIRGVRRAFSRELAEAPARTVLGVVWPLLRSDDTALRLVGYELCACHDGTMGCLSERIVRRLGVHLTSWFDADCLGKLIAGPAWRSGRISDGLVFAMAMSKNVYWRRSALVSTLGQTTSRTVGVCRKLRNDPEPMVWKALSWALRDLSKRDPEAVRTFVAEYEDVLASAVVREVRTKLETGTKAGRR